MQFLVVLLLIIFIIIVAVYYFIIEPNTNPLKRAEQFIENNSYDEAITEYKKILEENNYDFIAHYKIANIYFRMNEFDQAALHFEKIIEINQYNYQVDQYEVQKKLSKIYIRRGDIEKAFELFMQILQTHPGDQEVLYNVAFIALGQEEFDIAQNYFDKLVKIKKDDFEVAFGAGICCYQNQRISDAVNYFKIASNINNDSDVANLAMIFALNRKRDFRKVVPYIERLLKSTDDSTVTFLARRLDAFTTIHLQKFSEAMQKFEQLLDFAKKNDLLEEEILTRYDLGFAAVKSGQISKAYQQWNYISEHKRNYKNVNNLILMLRREMDVDKKKTDFEETVVDFFDDWLESAFPGNLLWMICGLKSNVDIDIRNYVVITKQKVKSTTSSSSIEQGSSVKSSTDVVEKYCDLELDMFKLITNRAVEKMGYRVDEIMTTYREHDGVDLMTTNKETKEKTYFWIRRWKKTKVGEIPIRNFAQSVNDIKAAKGVFITTSGLTESAATAAQRVNKIRIVEKEEFESYLAGLI